MTDCEMYMKFRSEVESMYTPHILKQCEEKGQVIRITEGSKKIGLFVVNDGYIDGLYILPEFRRKGYARKTVLDYVKQYGLPRDLHILNTNLVSKSFWESIFELETVEVNPIDTYYTIKSLKN